jgi:signal transduction histidine kinase
MKSNKHWKKLLMPYMITLLFVLLPVLAFLQYQWIGELSEREKENISLNLESSATQYSFIFSREIVRLQENFIPDDTLIHNRDLNDFIKNKFLNWRKQDLSGLLDSVYLINLENENECYRYFEINKNIIKSETIATNNVIQNDIIEYIKNYNFDFPNQVLGKFEYVIISIFIPDFQKSAIVLKLNKHYIIENIIKNNFNLYFKGYSYLNPVISIKSRKNELIYSNDTTFVKKQKSIWYDINIPIGMLPPPRNRMFQHHNHNDSNRIYTRPFIVRNKDRNYEQLPEIFKPATLFLGFRSGNLDSSIQSFRIRNLIISFSILLLLSVIIIIIIRISIKEKKLGNQQLQFVSGITHELRTPITVIRTASQNLADGIVTDNPKSKFYGSLILKESDKLWDMIETTLMFAGIESNKKRIILERISLKKIIESSVSNCQTAAKEKNIEITLNINTDLPEIDGDENSLIAAFQNIILNAIKFDDLNGTLDISATYKPNDKKILITFEDNGIGISRKDLPHIFEPFYRGKEAIESNIHGNGIGLSIVKNVLDIHNAKIKAESITNKGTKFIIYFPVAK